MVLVVPGARIRIGLPTEPGGPSPRDPMPLLTYTNPTAAIHVEPDPRILTDIGAPPELVQAVRAHPGGFRVSVGAVTTGDFTRLSQVIMTTPRQLPDPDQDWQVYPLSTSVAAGAACLAWLCLIPGAGLGLVGLILIAAGLR